MPKQLVIQSTDARDTPVDIEEKLEKAVSAIRMQREQKEFSDLFLRDQKKAADEVVHAVFSNMVEEIAKVLS